jgi:hypothetical protein
MGPRTPERNALSRAELVDLEEEIELLIRMHQEDIDRGFIAESNVKLRRNGARFREHIEGTPPKAPICNAQWISAYRSGRKCSAPASSTLPSAMHIDSDWKKRSYRDCSLSFRSRLKIASNPTCQRLLTELSSMSSCLGPRHRFLTKIAPLSKMIRRTMTAVPKR